jgi:hypothetical protein
MHNKPWAAVLPERSPTGPSVKKKKKMDIQEVGLGCGDWIELAQDRDRWRALVSTVMNFRVVPQDAGNFLISCKTS